ncbi:MAG: glycosyltransferase family 2 protein [Candidatus Aenigmatarchaeota archaeon]
MPGKTRKDVTVIIPVFNERRHIENVLRRVPKKCNIIVVDDGSTDGTGYFVQTLGHNIVRFEHNRGKAAACKAGINASRTELNVFIDGDGQLYPEEIPLIAEKLRDNDLVLGSRNIRCVPKHRKITNWLSRRAVQVISGRTFHDVLCGFRGIRKSSFSSLLLREDGYMFETDMLVQAVKNNLRIAYVPVTVSYNIGSRMPWPSAIRLSGKLIYESFKHVLGARY